MHTLNMLKLIILLSLITPFVSIGKTCPIVKNWFLAPYLNTVNDTPQRFAPDVISTDEIQFNTSMSSDGKALYFSTAPIDWSGSSARVSYFKQGQWTTPAKVDYSGASHLGADVHVSYDGHYFFKSLQGDIFRSHKIGQSWSKPEKLSTAVNSESYESYAVSNCVGDLFFQRRIDNKNWDLFVARNINGRYQAAQRLPENINSPIMEADIFVAPDESYMIFVRMRAKDSFGMSDLYISFNREGVWQDPINLGEKINSNGVDGSPFVSPDGQFLFFTSNRHAKNVEKFDGTLDIYVTRFDVNKWKHQ